MMLALLLATSVELDNGMEVVLLPDDDAQGVGVVIVYPVGFADEPTLHLAHVVEHMAVRRAAWDAADFVNAETMADSTRLNFYVADPAGLEPILAAEAERLRTGAIEEDRLAVERERAMSEVAGAPAKFKFAMMATAAALRHGETELSFANSTAAIDAAAIAAFRHPTAGATIFLAGRVDDATADLVRATLGAVDRIDAPAPWNSPGDGEALPVTWDVGVSGVMMAWPSDDMTAEERIAVIAFGLAAGREDGSRIGTNSFYPPDRLPIMLFQQGDDPAAIRTELETLLTAPDDALVLRVRSIAMECGAFAGMRVSRPPSPDESMGLQQWGINVLLQRQVRGGLPAADVRAAVGRLTAARIREIIAARLDPARARIVTFR